MCLRHERDVVRIVMCVRHVLRMLENLVDESADPQTNVRGDQVFETKVSQAPLHRDVSLKQEALQSGAAAP